MHNSLMGDYVNLTREYERFNDEHPFDRETHSVYSKELARIKDEMDSKLINEIYPQVASLHSGDEGGNIDMIAHEIMQALWEDDYNNHNAIMLPRSYGGFVHEFIRPRARRMAECIGSGEDLYDFTPKGTSFDLLSEKRKKEVLDGVSSIAPFNVDDMLFRGYSLDDMTDEIIDSAMHYACPSTVDNKIFTQDVIDNTIRPAVKEIILNDLKHLYNKRWRLDQDLDVFHDRGFDRVNEVRKRANTVMWANDQYKNWFRDNIALPRYLAEQSGDNFDEKSARADFDEMFALNGHNMFMDEFATFDNPSVP